MISEDVIQARILTASKCPSGPGSNIMVWIVNNILQGVNTMSAAQKIDSFRGKYYFLSNFFPAPVIYQGLTYQNNEAAFQAQKTLSQEQK